MTVRRPGSTLFPYTTLFRSKGVGRRPSNSLARRVGRDQLGILRLQVDELAEQRVVLGVRSEEHTSELQSPDHVVCRLLLEKKKFLTSRSTSPFTTHKAVLSP